MDSHQKHALGHVVGHAVGKHGLPTAANALRAGSGLGAALIAGSGASAVAVGASVVGAMTVGLGVVAVGGACYGAYKLVKWIAA